jgi:predicted SnoaL-like aldol condensation-catalyzing enzyme
MNKLIDYKGIASDFLNLSSLGKSREAFQKYVKQGFKHHNVFFKGDANSLMHAIEENAGKFPHKIFRIHHILHDGDLVAVHSHVTMNNDDPGQALMHIFRFESDKIIELWDFGQAVPENIINENGMF